MKVTIKNLKVHEEASEETLNFSCSVYIDEVRAFTAQNNGCGGGHRYYPTRPYDRNRQLLTQAHAWARTAPKVIEAGIEFEHLDWIIDSLIASEMERRQLKRWCKTKTVFRLPNMPKGKYKVIEAPFNAQIKAAVLGKYPNAQIINEVV